MIQLTKFGENPFDDSSISQNNFRQFSFDHLGKLKANNPGNVFDPRIAPTQAAFDQFDAVFGSKTLEEAIKKGSTMGLAAKVEEAQTSARKLEKLVSFHFGNPSPQYMEFFPKGLTELATAGKGEWPNILNRLKTSTAKYTATLGGTIAADFATLQAEYIASEDTQVGKKGAVNDYRTLLEEKRRLLATEMFTNLLTIALANVGKPAAILSYFDQSIVDRRQSSDSDGLGRFLVLVTTHNKEPLAGVLIDIQDSKGQNVLLNQKTDGEGRYKSSPLPIGTYSITFRLGGYVTRTQSFEVFDDKDTENEVQLTRE